eukprot:SAG31_NODE_24767_length_474_cov_1.098667_1_plen_35_part_01
MAWACYALWAMVGKLVVRGSGLVVTSYSRYVCYNC